MNCLRCLRTKSHGDLATGLIVGVVVPEPFCRLEWWRGETCCAPARNPDLRPGALIPGMKHPPDAEFVVERAVGSERFLLERVGDDRALGQLVEYRLQFGVGPAAEVEAHRVSLDGLLLGTKPVGGRQGDAAADQPGIDHLGVHRWREGVLHRRIAHGGQRELAAEAGLVEFHCRFAAAIEEEIGGQGDHGRGIPAGRGFCTEPIG
jgi:hypothetical protein